MALRQALRQVQDANQALPGPVIAAVQPAGPGGQPQGHPEDSGNALNERVEMLTAWIPTESIALFIGFGGVFNVFDNTTYEIALFVVVALVTVGYAIQASLAAQQRRQQPRDLRRAVITAALAEVAFLVWWFATPGSWLTADRGVDTFWVAMGLIVVTAGIPWLAKALKVEPLR
ncbi:MAG: hypothetical protein AAGD35_13550 [Actinomycetota bacterium]